MFDTKELATVEDPAIAPTVVAGSPEAREGVRTPIPPSSAATRNTVLPRVEIVGDRPTLVADEKRRFEPTRALGQGGVGEVVGAHDNDIGRPVALKRIRAEVKSEGALIRFVEEIRTIGRLEHPNIVPIHDVGLDEAGQYYFVMKYVDGETLEDIINKLRAGDRGYHARYTFERRVQVFAGILDAIAFAHEKGIIHRDIKPANVMVGAHGEVMVMDWGIAKWLRGPKAASDLLPTLAGQEGRAFETQVGTLIGTPAYMSPEQAMGERVDERCDIYALSVLFYEFLGLTHPLTPRTTLNDTLAGVIHERPKKLQDLKNAHQHRVPPELSWFVAKGLAKDPKDRYQSVTEMRERLRRRAEGYIPIECGTTLVKRIVHSLGRTADRHPYVVIIALFGASMVVLWALATTVYRAVAG